jgi:hypothetical protein
MLEIEYNEINLRLSKLEQSIPSDFLLGLYTDLVRQHINLLKDLVHNRFSREDFENQIRLENDVKILERNLENLNALLSTKNHPYFKNDINEMVTSTSIN